MIQKATLALLLLGLLSDAQGRRLLDGNAQAAGMAEGTSASMNTQAISASDPNSGMSINTALSTGSATDGSVRTGAAVQGQSGGSQGAVQTSGGASGDAASSTSAATSLVTPDTAAVGGFTNAQGTKSADSSTTTLTTNGEKTAVTHTEAAASSINGLLAAAGTSGTATVDPQGGQAVSTALAQTEDSSVVAKIKALFAGEQGQALAQILARALAGPGGASSANVNGQGSAQGSQSASISGDIRTESGVAH